MGMADVASPGLGKPRTQAGGESKMRRGLRVSLVVSSQ